MWGKGINSENPLSEDLGFREANVGATQVFGLTRFVWGFVNGTES